MRSYCKVLLAGGVAALLLAGFSPRVVAAANHELLVAISLDIPPFVMDQAESGLEVELVRQALGDAKLPFIQLSYEKLQTAVQQQRADVSVGVQPVDANVHYSTDFVTFANYAISKKADGLRIDSVADLSDHPVLTWENAYLELGSEFEVLFAPRSPQRNNYHEVADQEQQVRMFWEGAGRIIVIDRSIFDYFSRKLGHTPDEANYSAIFPPVTPFKVGFRDAADRDRFNTALAAMCKSGAYDELLKRYGVAVSQSVCD
jgi:polar amino acid transport system substrate-binding protein